MSIKLFRILTGLAGIVGVIALGVYFSGIILPRQLISGTATPAQLGQLAVQYHDVIFLDAWLQGTGALLSIIFFVALVYLAGAMTRFAGWMTMIGSGVLLAVVLNEGAFTFAAAQKAAIGHTRTALISADLANGVFGYIFFTVPAPFIFLSLGAVLLSSHVLPRIFGYLALALGIAFEIVGFASLFNALMGITSIATGIVQAGQVLWNLAAAIALLVSAAKVSDTATGQAQESATAT